MTILKSEIWQGNWKLAVASGCGLVLAAVLLFVPMAVVPVHATESYVVTEYRNVPATETVVVTETYAETVSRDQALFQGRLVPTEWDRYAILDAYVDLTAKTNPVIGGSFLSLDGRSIRFLIFDSYPYEIYPTAFTPAPIFRANQDTGTFRFVPVTNHYYFVFDNHAYSSMRFFNINAMLNWTETITRYRQVPKAQTTYTQVMFQVPQQRDAIVYERRSLFKLIAG